MPRLKGQLVTLLCLTLVTVAVACAWQGVSSAQAGVKRLVLIGDTARVSDRRIVAAAQGYLQAGFFELDVEGLRAAVAALPWIAEARVRRRWPDAVVLRLRQHVPVAFWRAAGVLTEDGTVIHPPALPALALPRLVGPQGSAGEVYARLGQLQAALRPVDAQITRLVLNARGGWTATLDDGLALRLGRVDVFARIQRFAAYGPPRIAERLSRAGYVDLRYEDGFAVGGQRRTDGAQDDAKGA